MIEASSLRSKVLFLAMGTWLTNYFPSLPAICLRHGPLVVVVGELEEQWGEQMREGLSGVCQGKKGETQNPTSTG
jgi:hypothetical protein